MRVWRRLALKMERSYQDMKTVFTFAQRSTENAFDSGHVLEVENGHLLACVEGVSKTFVIDTRDCSEALSNLVKHVDSKVVRVFCDVSETHVLRLTFAVDEAQFLEHMENGALKGEEWIIYLVREVWKEALLPNLPCEHITTALPECDSWNDVEMFPHQVASVSRMLAAEALHPCEFNYPGNFHIAGGWYVDTESESFTNDPSFRSAHVIGGVCADGTGSGKTATALRLMATKTKPKNKNAYESQGSLVLVPINLVAQWKTELTKFTHGLRCIWLVQGKDIRGISLESLIQADIVFTTFNFLRGTKYNEVVDKALEGRARSRGVFSSWARNKGNIAPVIEAVCWKRVILDEIHQVVDSPRDLRHLRFLRYNSIWGLSANKLCETEQAQDMYMFLLREKNHHPHLLQSLISHAVYDATHAGINDNVPGPNNKLELVSLSAEERLYLMQNNAKDVASSVRDCTFVDAYAGCETEAAAEKQFTQLRSRELDMLKAKAEGHVRSVCILEKAGIELESELQRLAEECAVNDDDVTVARAEVTRAACESHVKDLMHAKDARDIALARVQRFEEREKYVQERLAALRERRVCKQCTSPAKMIANDGNVFCQAHAPNEAVAMNKLKGIGTKMNRIGELIISLIEPVVLFVQWRSMVRGTKAFLKDHGIRVYLLEGSSIQRANTLHEFTRGGVLLLCLEEGFEGLHLPHAKHVIFAHAIVGDMKKVKRLENQAVARCVRRGQTDCVTVNSFIVADTEEEILWKRTH